MNDDAPAAAVHGGDDALAPDRLSQGARECRVDDTVSKERRARDDGVRAERNDLACALHAADPAADAAGKPAADGLHERAIVAPSACRIEIDELNAREARELRDPRLGIGLFDSQALALHQLYDMAVLEVDGRNQHR